MAGRFEPPDFDDAWDDDDPDGPQACDLDADDDDETPTVPCPNCRRPIPDFADRCPYCGDWIVQASGAPARRSPWVVVVAVLLIVAFLYWIIR